MKHVVVMVLPYGEPDREVRTPLEYVGYTQYLDACVEAIIALGPKVEVVMVPGFESSSVLPHLKRLLSDRLWKHEASVYMMTEEESHTTPANILFGYKKLIGEIGGIVNEYDLLIICDHHREGKVRDISKPLLAPFRRYGTTEVLGIHRPDIARSSNRTFQFWETRLLLWFPSLLRARLR